MKKENVTKKKKKTQPLPESIVLINIRQVLHRPNQVAHWKSNKRRQLLEISHQHSYHRLEGCHLRQLFSDQSSRDASRLPSKTEPRRFPLGRRGRRRAAFREGADGKDKIRVDRDQDVDVNHLSFSSDVQLHALRYLQ